MSSRRSFIKQSLVGGLSSIMGLEVVFAENLPSGLIPVLLQEDFYASFDKHQGIIILNDKPWNAEAQPHILDDDITPASKMFVRNNGLIPSMVKGTEWQIEIDGEAAISKKTYTLSELKEFPKHTYQLTLECAGNGRSEFNPSASGNQWSTGAVSCAQWSGVRLRDLLNDVGISLDAQYIGYFGADKHLSGDLSKSPISRGIPISKAMQDETLLAYEMNGEPIPKIHGFPLRLVAGGWPASASGKWIKRLSVRDKIHDGAKMGGKSYRVPCEPVAPGEEVSDDEMCIIESMPVKSLITYPKSGAMITQNQLFEVRGHAWAGENEVIQVEYSIDFGATWRKCALNKAPNRLAWQRWKSSLSFAKPGYYEIWVKATDEKGVSQPMVVPGWNPKGYLNNACHRIAIKVV